MVFGGSSRPLSLPRESKRSWMRTGESVNGLNPLGGSWKARTSGEPRHIGAMNLLGREGVLDCASPLALSARPADPSQSARGLAQSKTWREIVGSWKVSTSEVRTRIAAMNRRLPIFVPGGTKIRTALENGGSWVGRARRAKQDSSSVQTPSPINSKGLLRLTHIANSSNAVSGAAFVRWRLAFSRLLRLDQTRKFSRTLTSAATLLREITSRRPAASPGCYGSGRIAL